MSEKKITLNLPNFKLPENFDEEPLLEFQAELLKRGYNVQCKSTLAFFLIGRKYRLEKAADTFLAFVEYVEVDAKESPTEWDGQDYIHGICQQTDGTLCTYSTNYIYTNERTAFALSRQWVVYILANVTFDNITQGFSGIHDTMGFGWKNFNRKMEEVMTKLFTKSMPLRWKDFLIVDAPWWFIIIGNICKLFVPKKIMDRMKICKRKDVKAIVPNWKIPKQMGGTEEFKKLSMKFLMEYPYLIETPGVDTSPEEVKLECDL